MTSPSTAEAARIQQEIALLTGAINRHKSGSTTQQATGHSTGYPARPRNNTYVNPNYKPPSNQYKPPTKYVRPVTTTYKPSPAATRPAPPSQTHDIVIGGIPFESSGRSLVRKDLPKTAPSKVAPPRPTHPHTEFTRTKAGHLVPNGRAYKPKPSRGRGRGRGRPRGGPVNMTLDNSRRPYQSGRSASKRIKYSDKPCPRFTTTGATSLCVNYADFIPKNI
jgi:hypothetical protein